MKAAPTIGELAVGSAVRTERGWFVVTGHVSHGWTLVRYWDHEARKEELGTGPHVVPGSLEVTESYSAVVVGRKMGGEEHDPVRDRDEGLEPGRRSR